MATVWQPHLKGLQRELEGVQRVTRMLAELRPLPYNERLRALNLPCLEHRHRRGDMIDAYKYIRGTYLTSELTFTTAPYTDRSMRGNSLKLLKSFARTRTAYFSKSYH